MMLSPRSDCSSNRVSAQAVQEESSTAARMKERHIPHLLKED